MITEHNHDVNPQLSASQVPSYARTNTPALTLTEYQMVTNKSKCKYVLECHEHTSNNSDIIALCSSLMFRTLNGRTLPD